MTHEDIGGALRQAGTIAGAARLLGVERRRLSERVNADPDLLALVQSPSRRGREVITEVKGDDATVTLLGADLRDLGKLTALITRAGLRPREWEVIDSTVNEWEALAQGKGDDGEPVIATLRQIKVRMKRRISLRILSPARHVPPVERPVYSVQRGADLIVVEGDHQVPYHDPGLHVASLAFLRDVDPDGHVFLGDTSDFPTISRHPDHPAASATPQECIDATYRVLRDKREAAPRAWAKKLKGNHDWRLEGELLARAERLAGLSPAGETVPALSLRRMLQLDVLGIEFVEDPRGWQHGEIEITPRLVVRHGFVTGHNTAGRTMDKLGRSIIVGHDHSKQHHWKREPNVPGVGDELRQGVVVGTMSRVDDVFPHFAVEPDWHQGFVTVTRWPDGACLIEHATYEDDTLYWRDRRYKAGGA